MIRALHAHNRNANIYVQREACKFLFLIMAKGFRSERNLKYLKNFI
jgi:hypothetical protein